MSHKLCIDLYSGIGGFRKGIEDALVKLAQFEAEFPAENANQQRREPSQEH